MPVTASSPASSISPLRRRALALTGLASALALVLTGCGSDSEDSDDAPQAITPDTVEIPEDQVPEPSEESIALANGVHESEVILADQIRTGEELWSDRYLVAESIRQLPEPDLCQSATLEFMDATLNTVLPAVSTQITPDALVDEFAATEQLEIVLGTDYANAQDAMDTACREEESSEVNTLELPAEFAGADAQINAEQVVISDFVTAQTVELQTEELWIRYQATYPPSVDVMDLDDDHFESWADQAAAQIEEAFTLAQPLVQP